MTQVVITGGLGRIGQKLALRLQQVGHGVTVVTRQDPDEARDARLTTHGIAIHRADCFAPGTDFHSLMDNVDAVIHLSCSSNPAISEADPFADIDLNLKGTIRLFQAAQHARVKTFLFASSGGTVYGNVGELPASETTVPRPQGFHGAMKLACEQYLSVLAQRSSTRLGILRISNPYGMSTSSRQQGFIDIAIANLRAGRPITVWGDGSVRRDYLHVDDVTAAFEAALEHPGNLLVNIGSGQHHSLREVLAELGSHFDLTDRIRFDPSRAVDLPFSALDIQRAQETLGWQPLITLGDGIARAVRGS